MSDTSNESAPAPPPSEDPTLVGLFSTSDHKRIGRMFITVAVLFGVAAVVLEALLRIDLTDPDAYVLFDSQTFTQSFLMARDMLVFLFLVPIFLGIAMYVVPLQIGASGLLFPRAALASFWTWLISGGILIGAYLGNGGPFGGDSDLVDLHILALGFSIAALLVGVVVVVTTALTVRAPGLSLEDVPAFTWSCVVWGVALLLTLPVVIGNLVFVYIDHRYGRLFLGGNQGVWDHIEWAYRAPQLFVYVIPALGLAAEVLVGSARRRPMIPGVIAMGIGALGFFGMGAWAQLNLAEGSEITNGWPGVVYAAMFVGALLSIAVVVAMSLGTLGSSGKRPSATTPVLAAIGVSLLMLLAAVQASAGAFMDWAESLDWFTVDPVEPLRNTTWASGQFQLLVIGVGLLGAIGALSWWAPKVWGRSLNATVGRISVAVVFLGSFAAALGTSMAGLLTGQSELSRVDGVIDPLLGGIYGFVPDASSGLNVLTLVGSLAVATAALLFAIDLLISVGAGKGPDAEKDPWDAVSPEWMLESPPAAGPLTELPDLVSGAPALDSPEAVLEEAAT